MGKLPVISGQQAVGAFEKAGWYFQRRSRKNHIILKKEGEGHTLSVPDHPTLGRGLLRNLIKDAGLTNQEFSEFLSDQQNWETKALATDGNREKEAKEPKSEEIPPVAQYTNIMRVSHTENEFTFEFGQLIPDTSHGYMFIRLASSPQHTKKILNALKDNLEKYEDKYGVVILLEAPDRPRETTE